MAMQMNFSAKARKNHILQPLKTTIDSIANRYHYDKLSKFFLTFIEVALFLVKLLDY